MIDLRHRTSQPADRCSIRGILGRAALAAGAILLSPGLASCGGHDDGAPVPPLADGNFYASPTGDDTAPGTIDRPFRTLQHCASAASAGRACLVRGGSYRETIKPPSGITIEAYDREVAIVDGSDPVRGWTPWQNGIYRTSIALNPALAAKQLFVDTTMMTEARWPNGDDLFHPQWAIAGTGTSQTQLVDANLPAIDWTHARVHLWSGNDPWTQLTGAVVSSGIGQVGIDIGTTGRCDAASGQPVCPVPGGLYYLTGILAALDAPREWFYDATAGTLYFMAPGQVDPNTLDVRIKQRTYAFDLSGTRGVTIRGLHLFASTILMDADSADDVIDGIDAQYVSHATDISAYLGSHLRDSGLIVNGTGNVVRNSHIAWSAGNGIVLIGSGHQVTNNHIEYVDYLGDYSAGIQMIAAGTTITGNTIANTGRAALYPTSLSQQDIGYNDLSAAMLLTRDGAAIYTCCSADSTTITTRIHDNWIHDTVFAQPLSVGTGIAGGGGGVPAPIAGVYIDGGSGGVEVSQNFLWQNATDSVFLHGGIVTGGASDPRSNGNNDVHDNTVPDAMGYGANSIRFRATGSIATTTIRDNRVRDGTVVLSPSSQGVAASNNGPMAPGVTDPVGTAGVGCSFAGCATRTPPAF